MGYGAIEHDPFVSLQALIKIVDAEEQDGKFEETPLELKTELRVLTYEEQDEDDEAYIGHDFVYRFGFKKEQKSGRIGIVKSSKLGNLIKATVGEEVIDRGTFEAADLIGQKFRAQIVRSGKNEDGPHSRVKWNTMMPAPKRGQ
jgi:hypothetical protein